MALLMRCGPEEKFDADKMSPSEWAISLDTKYVRMCFAPGVVYRMATYESFEEDMIQIQQILATCEDIQTAVEAFEALAQQHANDAAASATASANSATASANSAILSDSWAEGGTGTRPGEDTNNAKYWAGVAQAVADVQIMTPTTNGIGKPDGVTIGVTGGTFSTKFKNYTSLADIGLTAPVTCLEIATAMPNNAQITLQTSSTETPVTDTPTNLGKLTIERVNNARCYAYFNEYTGEVVIPKIYARYIRPMSNSISAWTEYLTTGKLTNNLLATEAGTALDAVQGKALNDKITTNTTDISTINSKLTSIDVSSTFTYPATVTSFKAYKTGNMVHVNCLIADNATTKANVIITPSTYKPKFSYTTMANNLDGWEATIQMVVNTNISPATIVIENSNAKFTNTRLETYFEV